MPVKGLYVHVPFCPGKCPYCDFASVPVRETLLDGYLDALEIEANRFGSGLRPLTVYLGGGTPTVLDETRLNKLLEIIKTSIDASELEEWTIEANPATLSPGKIDAAMKGGVNRFSLGVQSLSDEALQTLGRRHDAKGAMGAYEMLRERGARNVSVDVIYAVPGTNMENHSETLERIIDLDPEHVSVYGLTWEEGTPYLERRKAGALKPVPEDAELQMYLETVRALENAGLMRYEVSSFARPGFESRHNKLYWSNAETLGLGPSAASFVSGERRKNVSDVGEYITRLLDEKDAVESRETLSGRAAAGEALYLSLRMVAGITDEEFRERTGMDLFESFEKEIERNVRLGLLDYSCGRLRLTDKGFTLADSVFTDFLESA